MSVLLASLAALTITEMVALAASLVATVSGLINCYQLVRGGNLKESADVLKRTLLDMTTSVSLLEKTPERDKLTGIINQAASLSGTEVKVLAGLVKTSDSILQKIGLGTPGDEANLENVNRVAKALDEYMKDPKILEILPEDKK